MTKILPNSSFKLENNYNLQNIKNLDFLDQNNSANYLNANCPSFTTFDKEKLSFASLWVLAKFEKCEEEVKVSLEKLEIASVIDVLYRFLWDEFAAWYLEFLKTESSDLEFGKAIFEKYIIILSPFAPFISQSLWENFFGKTDLLANLNLKKLENSPNLTQSETQIEENLKQNLNTKSKNPKTSISQVRPKPSLITLPKIEDKDLVKIEEFAKTITFVTKIRSLRGLFGIDFGTLIIVLTDNISLFQFAKFAKHLAKVQIEEINAQKPNLPTHSNLELKADFNIESKLNDLFEIKIGQKKPIIAKIDLISYIFEPQKQFEKAQKESENLAKQIEILQRQLQNPDFIQRAQSEIIEQKQTDLQERQTDLNFQTQKINFLQPLLTKKN